MIDDGTGLLTIGELARSTGLSVRTVRYWSDAGVLPPVTRSAGGYRLYDAASAARLELIRTLRELGLGLGDVRAVLAGEATVAEVAAAHVVALDARIRSLRVTRAVLSTVARRGSTAEEMTLMNRLARLSAAERTRILDDFTEEMFHGLDTADPVVRERMRSVTVDLPDDPTLEQVDAWVELADLLQNPAFRARMRKVAEYNVVRPGDGTPSAGRGDGPRAGDAVSFMRGLLAAGAAGRERGVAPQSPEGQAVLRELLGDADPVAALERVESVATDEVARYRELLAVVKGGTPTGAHRPEFAWVVAALRVASDR